jgi:formylglycine-generating enzyme required for sulfatase activity
VALAGAAAVGGGWWWSQRQPKPPPPVPVDDVQVETSALDARDSDDTTTGADDTTTTTTTGDGGASVEVVEVAPEQVMPLYASPWSSSSMATTLVAGVPAALLVILGLRWLLAGTLRDRLVAQGRAARNEAVERDGAEEGELYCFKAPAPLDPTAIDAAADLLGRPSHDEEGTRLDVPRTLDRTVRAGGQPQPRFLQASRQPPLLVLVDVEQWGRQGQAHPMAHAVEWILERWQRTGLRLERFDYAGNLATEVRGAGGSRPITLQELARRHGGARLLVWTRLRRLRDAQLAAWLAALRPWERRAWIDLDPRPVGGEDGREEAALGRLAEVERSGLARYPLTRQGIVAAARHVAAPRGRPPAVTDEVVLRPGDHAQHERIDRALSQWAAAACCVPDPAWPHLDVLRTLLPEVRRVIPEARGVWWLLRWLERQGCLEGTATEARDRLALRPRADVKLLKLEQHIEVGGQPSTVEQWVRQRLEQQLHDGAAASSGVTRQIDDEARQAKLAYHRCARDPVGGVEALGRLLGTTADPLARELLARLGHRIDAGAMPGMGQGGSEVIGRAKAALGERVAAVRGERVKLGEAVRQRPRGWEVAVAAGVMGAVVVGTRDARPGDVVGTRVDPAVYEVVLREDEGEKDAAEPIPDVPVVEDTEPPPLPKEETVTLELPPLARAMRLVRIDAGEFWMGSTQDEADHQEDEQRHRVTLTDAFYMCETEVTQAQWMAVMGTNPSDCRWGCGDDLPVHDVSWDMAVDFLDALSRKCGLAECYAKSGDEWTWDRACDGYRLPTEAEWEYAARATTQTAYSFEGDAAGLGEHVWYAWYGDNAGGETHPVATRRPNPWGLYDVHGNVWEWVWDRYEDYYGAQPKVDPIGPRTGEYRVLRGGAFNREAYWLRSAYRGSSFPSIVNWSNGLRCARGPHPSHADVP